MEIIRISKTKFWQIICDRFYCSDSDNHQYPDCQILKEGKCKYSPFVDQIITAGRAELQIILNKNSKTPGINDLRIMLANYLCYLENELYKHRFGSEMHVTLIVRDSNDDEMSMVTSDDEVVKAIETVKKLKRIDQ
ncbi:MAG: hypothetical protein JXI43_10850 [Tissierellales bacterium]|nr:hypothetical protein [Tissierellales bacterium]